jgi:hypothetical protein
VCRRELRYNSRCYSNVAEKLIFTSEPGPLGASEVRHENICVLEIGDENQVVVGDHVWDQVVSRDSGETC